MKTSKLFQVIIGWASAAVAAAALFAASPAYAALGDVYSIETISGEDSSGKNFPNSGDPLTVGQQASFRIRLLNRMNGDTRVGNSWRLKYAGTEVTEELLEALSSSSDILPKVGVIVSGTLKYAEIASIAPAPAPYSDYFTDLTCVYRVRGGDIALPLALADENGNEVGSGESSATYKLFDTYNMWEIVDATGTPLTFSFGVQSSPPGVPAENRPVANRNYSLTSPTDCMFIQTVDFSNVGVDVESAYWRQVYEGMTTCVAAGLPALTVPGGMASGDSLTVYLWSSDPTALSLPDADDGTAYGHPVQTLVIDSTTLDVNNEITFRIRGENSAAGNNEATIFLSASPTNRYDKLGNLITNFLTRAVCCVEAPEPFITFTFDDGGVTKTVSPEADPEKKRMVPVTVTLSKPYPDHSFTLKLNPELAGADVFDDHYIGLSTAAVQNENSWVSHESEITVGGSAETKYTFYVYALGGDAATAAAGVRFTPTIEGDAAAAAFFSGLNGTQFCRLMISDINPIVVEPVGESAEDPARLDLTTEANNSFEITMQVWDAYRDLVLSEEASSNFTVTAYYVGPGQSSYEAQGVVFPNSGAPATVTLKAPSKAGVYERSYLQVTDGNGKKSNKVYFSLTALAPRTITVNLTNADGTPYELHRANEGDFYQVSFTLSQPYDVSDLYAFLVPLNEKSGGSENSVVESQVFTRGLKITRGATNSIAKAAWTLKFLDGGDDAADLAYRVMLRDSENIGEGSEVLGACSPDPNQDPFSMSVDNLPPSIENVFLNNGPVTPGELHTSAVSAGVPTTFDAVVADAAVLWDFAPPDNPDEGMVTRWRFSRGMPGKQTYEYVYITSRTVNASCEWTFNEGGTTQTVAVAAQDKDMRAANAWSEEFQFSVYVIDPPEVIITPSHVDGFYDEKDGNGGYITVSLSEMPTEDLTVHLEVANAGGSGQLLLAPDLKQTTEHVTELDVLITPKNAAKGVRVYLMDMDGTPDTANGGFMIYGTVTTDTENEYHQPWSEYYTEGECEIFVENVDPVIRWPAAVDGTNESVSVNETITLDWTIQDVLPDLQDGLQVVWTPSSGTGLVSDEATGSYSFAFTSEGHQKVTLTVTDKDGGSDSRTWFYYIAPTKHVTVNPWGPAYSTLTKYSAYAGVGEGRIYADGNRASVENFTHTWYYNEKVVQGTLWAYGYAGSEEGYFDDGTLTESNDVAITSSGYDWANHKTQPFFRYESEYDNFFYCWVDLSQTAALDTAGVPVSGVPNPAVSPLAPSRVVVKLDDYEEGKSSYEVKNIEAIFSREYYLSDNLGDINADSIPDIYVKKYGFNGMGGEGGDAAAAVDDSVNLRAYNEDDDYLPLSVTPIASIIPGVEDSWQIEGVPFTANLEIRGFGPGLNDAPVQVGIRGAAPDRDFTELEQEAYEMRSEGDESWSPERPTDPTNPDTDEDGFSDGYEYYFWYHAKVGYMDNGVHKFLQGERYDTFNPAQGIPISPEEICEIFDPQVAGDALSAASRDTDNDGLTDHLEFLIGTNPLHWDTDGDGLPDGYEVFISATNPLLADSNTGVNDAVRNPDGDYMAYYRVDESADWRFYRVADTVAQWNDRTSPAERTYRYIAVPADAELTTKRIPIDAYMSEEFEVVRGTNIARYVVFCRNGDKSFYGADVVRSEGAAVGDFTLAQNVMAYEVLFGYEIGSKVMLERGTRVTAQTPINDTYYLKVLDFDWATTNGMPNRVYSAWVYGKDVGAGVDRTVKCETCNGTGHVLTDWERNCNACGGNGRLIVHDETPFGAFVVGKPLDYSLQEDDEDVHYLDNGSFRIVDAELQGNCALIHHQVYQQLGFDPRTAWNKVQNNVRNSINTRDYTTYDEFLVHAFFYYCGGLTDEDIIPTVRNPLVSIWQRYCTNPRGLEAGSTVDEEGNPTELASEIHGADTDGDGIPDGWELYVMAGHKVDDNFSAPHPTDPAKSIPNGNGRGLMSPLHADPGCDVDNDGVIEKHEFDSTESIAVYAGGAETIAFDEGWTWFNKMMPTDPWNGDTDGDGLGDGEERDQFSYGDPTGPGAGAGLNPLSWDTDGDGLPDPWEVQYAGTPTQGDPSVTAMQTETTDADGNTTTTTESTTNIVWTINNGMDGTVADASSTRDRDCDWDHDGLQNWQEYLTGAMRVWRYDDPITPLATPNLAGFAAYEDLAAAPDEFWAAVLVDNTSEFYNPHVVFGPTFDNGAYMSLCTNVWDTACGGYYFFYDGVYHNLAREEDSPYIKYYADRYTVDIDDETSFIDAPFALFKVDGTPIRPMEYFGCSPLLRDTDGDGMDDYYELFHGLNPLLGSGGAFGGGGAFGRDMIRESLHVVDSFYVWNAYRNNWNLESVWGGPNGAEASVYGRGSLYDFTMFPWMNGEGVADADGDNIRNQEEAIMPNLQAASTWHHTDPSALWMTDVGYTGSMTCRSYLPVSRPLVLLERETFMVGDEVHYFTNYEGFVSYAEGIVALTEYNPDQFRVQTSMWSFEENEGYDSDHDGRSDYAESQATKSAATDPQDHNDPARYQAMYFNGRDAFCATPMTVTEAAGGPIETKLESPFLQYTCEAWVKAENPGRGPQTILERTVASGLSNPADEKTLRKNFFIGIDEEGRFYTMYDSKGTDLTMPVVTVGPEATTDWTHLAATFDGKALRLYVNGQLYAATASSVQPQNDVAETNIHEDGTLRSLTHYSTIAFFVGASPLTAADVNIENGNFYVDFFEGYVDEVRVWDGARKAGEILDAYMVRMTDAMAADNREQFFDEMMHWGGYRSWNETWLGGQDLTAELRYHYNFGQLFAAAEASQVATAPAGFTYDGTDGRALLTRPEGYEYSRWTLTPRKSTVYTDYAWVPWIHNTVHHLPRFDGTTQDSLFWSVDYAGLESATSLGFYKFGFPLTHEVNSRWVQALVAPEEDDDSNVGDEQEGVAMISPRYFLTQQENGRQLSALYGFTLRNAQCDGYDMLPMGGAFVKYIDAMWEDGKPSTLADQTGSDSDNDGLPDWWEAAYGDYDWDELITFDGEQMTAGEAYMRSIAKGAHEGAADGDERFAQTADRDGNGIADWWQDLYKVEGKPGQDSDLDGLPDGAEYLIYDGGFLYDSLNPLKPRTDGVRLDYFRTVGKLYFGEVFTDHDMMEDDWETAQGDLDYTSPFVWDANRDPDHDGWSNFAECRYDHDRRSIQPNKVSHMVGDTESLDLPMPAIRVKLRYGSSQRFIGSNAEGGNQNDNGTGYAPIVFNFFSKRPVDAIYGSLVKEDATFTVTPGATVAGQFFLGTYTNRVVKGTLGPGHIDANSLVLMNSPFNSDNYYKWTIDGVLKFGTYEQFRRDYRLYDNVVLMSDAWQWEELLPQYFVLSYNEDRSVAYMYLNGLRIGEVNLDSGAFEIDMGAFDRYTVIDVSSTNETDAVAMKSSAYRLDYTSTIGVSGFANGAELEFNLCKADSGYVKEGLNSVTAFADLDGDGKYTPGEPFGIATGVDVGWDRGECTIELTDTHPVFARVDVTTPEAVVDDRNTIFGSSSGDFTNIVAGASSGGVYERVRVVRTLVNGHLCSDYKLPYRVVLDKWLDVANRRSFIHEGDFIADGEFDVDWAYLNSDISAHPVTGGATSIVYRVVLGNGPVDMVSTNNNLGVGITRFYDAQRSVPTGVSPMNGAFLYGANPTFKWSMGSVNTYTAFRVRVQDESNAVVWTSPVLPAPARDPAGYYTWTAPLFAGDQTSASKLFAPGANYKWSVTMLNSKFRSEAWSTALSFRLDTNTQSSQNDHGYGSVDVAVKYFGPSDVVAGGGTAASTKGMVRVEAFSNADFSGMPAARGFVAADKYVTLTNDATEASVRLIGLKPGVYYVRAYVDTDFDFERDEWESWGYSCYRESAAGQNFMFTPKPVTVTASGATGLATVYIEDCDTDGDWLPDAWEMATQNSLTRKGPVGGTDGYVEVNPELMDAVTHSTIPLYSLSSPTVAALLLGVEDAGSDNDLATVKAIVAETGVAAAPTGVVIDGYEGKASSLSFTAGVRLSPVSSGSSSKALKTYVASGITGTAPVTCRLLYAPTLDGEWTTVKTWQEDVSETGSIEVEVDLSDLAGLDPDSGFFKVVVE